MTPVQEFDRGDHLKPHIHADPRILTPSVTGLAWHGDAVAAMAVGKYQGVASRADLTGLKVTLELAIDQWYDVWHWMLSDVRAKGLGGKAVVNFSGSKHFKQLAKHHTDLDHRQLGIYSSLSNTINGVTTDDGGSYHHHFQTSGFHFLSIPGRQIL